MDPIIASGLFTIGKAFADRMAPAQSQFLTNSGIATGNINFSNVLNATIDKVANVNSVSGVQNLENMHIELKSLYKNFLGNTDIPLNFKPQNDGLLVTINIEKGNKIFITNESGQKLELSVGGNAYKQAEEMLALKNQINTAKGVVKTSSIHLTGSSIY
jgi:hypothetical protein